MLFGKSVREKVSVMDRNGRFGSKSGSFCRPSGQKKSFPILIGKLISFIKPVRDQAAWGTGASGASDSAGGSLPFRSWSVMVATQESLATFTAVSIMSMMA